jgi:hypothetical protein
MTITDLRLLTEEELTCLGKILQRLHSVKQIDARLIGVVFISDDEEHTLAQLFIEPNVKTVVEIAFSKFNKCDIAFSPEIGQRIALFRALRRLYSPKDQEAVGDAVSVAASA